METVNQVDELSSFKIVSRLVDVRKRTPFATQRDINEDHLMALQQDFLLMEPDVEKHPIYVTLLNAEDTEKARDLTNFDWIHVTQVSKL